ncbi:LLM class F420-dependent oxidoreductase [Amycolatopsis sp. NPDC051903]|uniref:LLM class F420-dependent oxidoreductase n=1 Tax=Amycolatopsis sp. NPDC051903 TaxID=3363936 RepID=UPI0037B4202B
MCLGWDMGYWSSSPHPFLDESTREAERLGLHSIWAAESYGSDSLTPLAWVGSRTTGPALGTACAQMAARTPTAVAMAAMTMDHLSDGRFVLGLGSSGPQVVEGWYGQEYRRPLQRTREYVEIVRKVIAREGPVEFHGEHFTIPAAGGTGFGKPLRANIRPRRPEIPIFLGAQGPKNVALAAEIADGWLSMFFGPKLDGYYRAALAEGFSRPGAQHTAESFTVVANVNVRVDDDVERAADGLRPLLALYIGGMGAAEVNFHRNVFTRLGYEAECEKITRLYLDGHRTEAIAAVSTRMVEEVALIGPAPKIRHDLQAWETTVVDVLSANMADPATLRTLAELMA